MNGKVEVTWRTLRTVVHALMVHARVLEVYVHSALMYTTYHIFPVLPIKYLINEDGDPKRPHKLATGTKPSVSHLRVLFCPCVLRKATAHVETKMLNMRHQAQKGFRGIFIGIPEHQKGHLMYVPSTKKEILSYDVVFDQSFSSALSYTSRPYAESMAMRPTVTYTPYATYSKEQTGNVITFTQFEERNLLTETLYDAESSDESDSKSIMISEKDKEILDEIERFDDDLISTETLHDIRDGNQTHPKINKREARMTIRDRIKQKKLQWKGALRATHKMGKGLYILFSTIVSEISQELTNFGETGSEVSHFIPEPRNFAEVTKLAENIIKPWLKATLKEIKNLINNQTFMSLQQVL